ncbi:hypothetical protein QBC43DRAFT_238883 [Cladorrhinum sp. PSN259]|nr:hypothetical protein QBC43DRAFT_238883 [Cladorrhinum sp. PSN259]
MEVDVTNTARVAVLLGKAGLAPPLSVPKLDDLSVVPWESNSSEESNSAARVLLAHNRTNDPNYRPPEKQKRNWFRLPRQKEEKHNVALWTFTNREVARAFNHLLSFESLPPPDVTLALLSHASVDSLNELWYHFHSSNAADSRLNTRSSLFGRSSMSVAANLGALSRRSVPQIKWLDIVTDRNNAEYVRLLCQAGPGQEALDRALGIALSKYYLSAAKVLLQAGAVASAYQNVIRDRVGLKDVALVKLLLSASPRAMSVEAWRSVLEPEVNGVSWDEPPEILLLCLAHRPEIATPQLVIWAFASENYRAAAIVLAYASRWDEWLPDLWPACQLASRVEDAERRYRFFELLSVSQLLKDDEILREELMKDVQVRHSSLVRLLVAAGVCLDVEPNNAVRWAASKMDLDVLELFQEGNFSSPTSSILTCVPDSASEMDMVRLLGILAPRGIDSASLDKLLAQAAQKQQGDLVETLLRYGASVEFEQASAIQTTLKYANLGILSKLLQVKCSPEILSASLPVAFTIRPRDIRRQAMKALLEKGVLRDPLGTLLQDVVAEEGQIDSELVQLVLEYDVPLDVKRRDDIPRNAVLQAAARCDLTVLRMLCMAEPKVATLSMAVYAAFMKRSACGYSMALDATKLLLEKGANGKWVNHTLLAAVKDDQQLDFVRVLVKYGGRADDLDNSPFLVALKTENIEALKILCAGCPPNRASIEAVLFTAIDPQFFNLEALDLLLGSCSLAGAALNALWSFERLRGNPNISAIISCFLKHGLNVNLDDGAILCFAVEKAEKALLDKALSANPSIPTLAAAFSSAINVEPRDFKLKAMKALLEKADSAEIGQSKAFLGETMVAGQGDLRGFELLLSHKANVNHEDGVAVAASAAFVSRDIMVRLLEFTPSVSILRRTCLIAAETRGLDSAEKEWRFNSLLNASRGSLAKADNMSALLVDSVTQFPQHERLPKVLLKRGAKIRPAVFGVALHKSSQPVFVALAKGLSVPQVAELFWLAVTSAVDPERRYWICEILLARGVPPEYPSRALVENLEDDVPEDTKFPELLLKYGASVGYKECAALSAALESRFFKTVNILISRVDNEETARMAFKLVRDTAELEPAARLWAYRSLLNWKISKPALFAALVEHLRSDCTSTDIVDLLLTNGANPNGERARCFVIAANLNAKTEFRSLSKYAKVTTVLKALIDNFDHESKVLEWYKICLKEQPASAVTIKDDEVLFKCLSKFRKGKRVLKKLLEGGVSVSTKREHRLCPAWLPEPCTPLIWALFHTPKIENAVILELLAKGHAALPTYSTPTSHVSAAFACLLDRSRTPILEALLDLDRNGILEYEIPASTFAYLGAFNPKKPGKKALNPSHIPDGLPPTLPLRTAAMFLGNLEAYCALGWRETRDDGNLHTAAFLALPKFVAWLLDHHDPNAKVVDQFDQMIPMALVCSAQTWPWCKVANSEAKLITRQKETMRLLAARTRPDWRYRGKTVLHCALEAGVEVTKAMAEALEISDDPQRNEKYLYKDKEGIEYSPHQWVKKFLGGSKEEVKALVDCLDDLLMNSRLFRRVSPEEGSQPEGYHGLPDGLAREWYDHEYGYLDDEEGMGYSDNWD